MFQIIFNLPKINQICLLNFNASTFAIVQQQHLIARSGRYLLDPLDEKKPKIDASLVE